MKERFEKKLVRNMLIWAVRVERMEDENWKRGQTPRKWSGGEKEAMKTENRNGDGRLYQKRPRLSG